ncbi:MAG: histidine phosphatase family protein [Anaerolineae bacterium]|nr:histidine phosphatase family protein [Anaerolineae bacterium]
MEVLLIRHGDPDYANDSLTERGVDEARQLANALSSVPIDALYVSPLGRAQETCAWTAQLKDVTPITLDWLRERGIKRGPVYLWEAPGDMFLRDDTPGMQHDWFEPDGAMPEGREQFERVREGFNDLLRSYGYDRQGHGYRVEHGSNKRVALFCHKGVILTLLADILHWALPMVFVSLHIHPSGVTRLEMVEHDGFAHLKALAINDLSHLGSTLLAPPTHRTRKAEV